MFQSLGKSSRGFTLTEMAVVMAVIGILLGTLWAMSARPYQLQRANDAVAELQFSASNIIGILQGQTLAAPYGNDQYLTTQMLNGRAIPQDYQNPGGTTKTIANHPWGQGLFRVYKQGAQTFRIAFYIVPTEGCIQLLTQGTSCDPRALACPQKILVKNGSVTKDPDSTSGWEIMTIPQAKSLCEKNAYPTTDETLNSVEFEYSLL